MTHVQYSKALSLSHDNNIPGIIDGRSPQEHDYHQNHAKQKIPENVI